MKIVRFQGLDDPAETEKLARGEPGDSQFGAFLEERSLVCADAATAPRIPHDQLDQKHGYGVLGREERSEVGVDAGFPVRADDVVFCH